MHALIRRLARGGVLSILGFLVSAPGGPPPDATRLPPIAFVSRQPLRGDPGAIPGFGPHHRAVVTGGRLLVREPGGRLRELLPPGALFDVSDPAVSFDARRIAFAGTPSPDSAWRIYVVNVDGTGLRQITFADPARDLASLGPIPAWLRRDDDLDPCWIDSTEICFASTRYPQRAQYADVPVTNLYVVGADPAAARPGLAPLRITSERNGAEEPALDPRNGRIVFARWWFNRWRAARDGISGITIDPALAAPRDSVNLWQPMEITPDGFLERLRAGDLRTRRGSMLYQPAFLSDTTLVGVYAANLGLSPRPGGTGIHRLPLAFGPERRLAGAIVEGDGEGYGGTRGLAPPSACAPAGLPDGRVLFAYAPGARGDFGLFVMQRDGSAIEPVVDLPGTLELDPTPIVERRQPLRDLAAEREERQSGGWFTNIDIYPLVQPSLPPVDVDSFSRSPYSFVFDARNIFANGPVDSPMHDAPRVEPEARIRFFAVLARPAVSGGDTAVLLREAPVKPDGSVLELLPADVPLFEQIVDAHGRVLLSAHGPAHVAGLNAGRSQDFVRCVGCHTGHSSIALPSPEEAPWFNASSSADVTASSVAPGTAARAVADRRTRGPAEQVAWVAEAGDSASVSLRWTLPLEVREIVLHNVRPDRGAGTDLRVRACTVRCYHAGREVTRRMVSSALEPGGTRVALEGPQLVDRIEVEITRASGRIHGQRRVALAEIETVARLPVEAQ